MSGYTITLRFGDNIEPFVYEYDPNFERNMVESFYARESYNNGKQCVIDSPYSGETYREYTRRLKLFDNLRKKLELTKIKDLQMKIRDIEESNQPSSISLREKLELQLDNLKSRGVLELPTDLYHRVYMTETEFYKHRYVISSIDGNLDHELVITSLLNDNTLVNVINYTKEVVIIHFNDIPNETTLHTLFYNGVKTLVFQSSREIEFKLGVEGVEEKYESIFDDYYQTFLQVDSIDAATRFEFFTLINYTSFLDNKTALTTLTKMLGMAIKKCKTVKESRTLCGLEDDFTQDENTELTKILDLKADQQ